jgi:putative ABC transport system permease protein
MRALFRLVSLGRNLVFRKKKERDLADEIASLLELLVAAKVRDGFSQADARRLALLEIGGAEQLKEQVREVRAGYSVEAIVHDLRYSARVLFQRPLFTAAAVLTLALSIGAGTTAFALIKSKLWRPLAYTNTKDLLQITAWRESHDADVSFPRFTQIQAQNDVFTDVAALVGEKVTVHHGRVAEQVSVARVSDRFFNVLAVQPGCGRFFRPNEHSVVLLSDDYWRKNFGGNRNAIGQFITLAGARTEIIGILPDDFTIPFGDFDVYAPQVTAINFLGKENIDRGAGYLKVIARARPDVSFAGFSDALRVLDLHYRESALENMDANTVLRALPLRETAVRQGRPVIYAIAAAVACLLVLSSVNVVNLILGRLARREREIAVRYALGAGRRRIFQQLISENVLIALLAGISGVLLARIGFAIINFLGSDFLRSAEWKLDRAAIGFASLLTIGNALLLSIAAVIHGPRDPKGAALRQAAQLARPAITSLRACLLVIQVALSLLLATGAGLLLTSLYQVQKVDPGLDPDGVLVADIAPPYKIAERDNYASFTRKMIAEVKAIGGVTNVAAIYGLPLAHDDTFLSYTVANDSRSPVGVRPLTWYRSVSPDYFDTMRIPLRMGRPFTDADRAGNPNVVIISETTARLLFANDNPLGGKIICGGTIQKMYEVIGVVGDVRSLNLDRPVREEMYFSLFQSEEPSVKLVARIAPTAPMGLVGDKVAACLRTVQPNQSTITLQTMRQIIARSLARGRFVALALTFFAGLALFVAMIGIYGVMDYAVSVRTREIGIRLALGARRRDVFRLIIARGMKLVAAGLVIGALVASFCTPLLSTLLYDVRANDPIIFLSATLLLAIVAFLANYLPARRAMRVAPLIALQYE